MSNQTHKRSRGKRGGAAVRSKIQRDIHSSIEGLPAGHHAGHAHNLKGKSTLVLAASAAKYHDCALIEERAETHVVPLKALTVQQELSLKPQQVELAEVRTRQANKGDEVVKACWDYFQKYRSQPRADLYNAVLELRMVETTDNRLVWKSDRSLLIKGNPFELQTKFKREGTISEGTNTRKYREVIHGEDHCEGKDRPGIAADDIEVWID